MQESPIPSTEPSSAPKSGMSRELLIILGILSVGCCVVVGLGVSGYFLFQGYQKNASSTATAVAATQAREVANAEAAQHAEATATAKARRAELAGYDFFDDFHNNANDWYTGDEDSDYWRGSISLRDGTYTWDVRETKQPFVAWEGYPSQASYQDFDVSVEVRRDAGPENQACYGLLFRESPTTNGFDDGAYTFSVCDTQQFSVHYFSAATDWEALIDWTDAAAIHPGEWNRLGIQARGDEFTFLINDQVVGTVTDARSPEGYIYVYIDIYESATALLRFDNFALASR